MFLCACACACKCVLVLVLVLALALVCARMWYITFIFSYLFFPFFPSVSPERDKKAKKKDRANSRGGSTVTSQNSIVTHTTTPAPAGTSPESTLPGSGNKLESNK